MADTVADRRDAGSNSCDPNMGSVRKGRLSWWSVIRAEITCFVWFIGNLLWFVFLALMLITGITVAVDHSFIWGLVILVGTMYAMDRTGL